MELNVFTQQLEQCYNILSQQFIIIKQLKDLTLGTQNESSAINELNQRLSGLENTFEDLVRATPTDVRVVKNQDKWQLQLEHDSNVLSIDDGLQTALNENKLYKHQLALVVGNRVNDDNNANIEILVLSTSPYSFTTPDELVDASIIFVEKTFTYDDELYTALVFTYDGSSNYNTLLLYYTPYDLRVSDVKVKEIISDEVY